MAKWQNRMTKMIKSALENTKSSSTDTDEIRVAINEVLATPPPHHISVDNVSEVNSNIEGFIAVEESSNLKTIEDFDVDLYQNNQREILIDEVEPTPSIIETSVIHAGTKILGNIESDDFLILYASINGNINCTQKLTAYETINGDVVADSIEYHGVSQTGNITVNDSCIIADDNTSVNGDIVCTNLACNGTVIGNIRCTGTCYLEATANIDGDIHTGQLSTRPGAIIKGKISMDTSSNNQ